MSKWGTLDTTPETSGRGPDRSHSMYGTIPQIVPIWPLGQSGTICGMPRKQGSGSDPSKGVQNRVRSRSQGSNPRGPKPRILGYPVFRVFRGSGSTKYMAQMEQRQEAQYSIYLEADPEFPNQATWVGTHGDPKMAIFSTFPDRNKLAISDNMG